MNMQMQQENVCFPTLINSHSVITGNITLTTDVRVDGTVHGVLESEKNIFIGVDGYVKGVVRANNLVSFGRIEGSVIVSGITVLNPGSILFGKLYTKDINVLPGAVLSAKIVTYDILDPIDEAQISIDEEKTRTLANKLSVVQKNLNSFPSEYKRNQVLKETIHIENLEDNDILDINQQDADDYCDAKYACQQEEITNNSLRGPAAEYLSIDPTNRSTTDQVPDPLLNDSIFDEPKKPVQTTVSQSSSNSSKKVKKEEQHQSIFHISKNKSLIFNSLMNQTSAENTNTLINEVEKLNLASRETFTIKERKNNHENLPGSSENKFSRLKAVLRKQI